MAIAKPPIVVCVACAEISSERGAAMIVCPKCGFRISRRRYDRMLAYARRAALQGHLYHEQYKRDREQNRGHVDYYISIDDALVFAGLAALSGVIGNAAYDMIKAFISRLRSQGLDDSELKENRVNVFIQNVQNYHIEHTSNQYIEIVEPVKREVAKELLKQLAGGAEERGEKKAAKRLRREAEKLSIGPFDEAPKRRDFEDVGTALKSGRVKRKAKNRKRGRGA